MALNSRNGKFSHLFWIVFILIAVSLIVYYFAAFEAIDGGVWTFLKEYDWIFRALFFFLIAMVVSKLITKLMGKEFRQIEKDKKLRRKLRVDRTRLAITEGLAQVAVYFIAVVLIVNSVPQLRNYSASLLAGVGFAAIVVGFAAKETISNIIAGVLIAIYEPFRVGDRIEFGQWSGKVEDLSLRHTVIRTRKNERVVVPNAIISEETLTNYSMEGKEIIKSLDMHISYGSDLNKAKKIMVEEVQKHPSFIKAPKRNTVMEKGEAGKVILHDFEDSSLTLRLYFWARRWIEANRMAWDLREAIKKRFDQEGIEIPYPYRTIVYKKDLEK